MASSMLVRLGRRLSPQLRSPGCYSSTRAFATEELGDIEDSASNAEKARPSAPAFQGVYKAVLLGELIQPPTEIVLKSGKSILNLLVTTGGMRVSKKAGETQNQDVKQVHKVVIYNERFREVVGQKLKKGTAVYLEGNMESRVFNDPVTGAVKVIKEIAVRHNGRLFLVDELELRGANNKSNAKFNSSAGEIGEEHGAEDVAVR